MSETVYAYPLTDFPNGKANSGSLRAEILGSSIATSLTYITVNSAEYRDACAICFDAALSAEDKTTLDGVVAAHQGVPLPYPLFRASSKVMCGERAVAEQTWETVGGVVTDVAFFVSDVDKAWGRLSGEVKVSGSGAQVRMIRVSDGALCSEVIDVPDTGGDWQILSFWANQNQVDGSARYELQGQLNGATSLELRDYAISLMELITS